MDEATRKNTLAIEQALKSLNAQLLAQYETIAQLVALLADVMVRLEAAEKTILELRAARAGTGPTVR